LPDWDAGAFLGGEENPVRAAEHDAARGRAGHGEATEVAAGGEAGGTFDPQAVLRPTRTDEPRRGDRHGPGRRHHEELRGPVDERARKLAGGRLPPGRGGISEMAGEAHGGPEGVGQGRRQRLSGDQSGEGRAGPADHRHRAGGEDSADEHHLTQTPASRRKDLGPTVAVHARPPSGAVNPPGFGTNAPSVSQRSHSSAAM
jgi:hypothetical protein